LAVLPLENLTGDPDQEYISDGVTDEMITRLGGLRPSRLGVIARTSVMGYKHSGKSVTEIGSELGVQYVVEGSVRQAAGRFRITSQLIQVSDQSHLWAEEYDRNPSDMLAVEADVARAVADEIRLRLAPLERPNIAPSTTLSPEAYDLYLHGRYALNKRTIDGFQKAQTFFQQAIAVDPTYTPAHSGLAESQIVLAAYGVSAEPSVLQARLEAKKALALDQTLAEPHAVLALIAQNHDWNWDQAEREYRLALAADPNYATAHHWYGLGLALRGRFEDSFREIEIAQQLDPCPLLSAASGAKTFIWAAGMTRL
jgi:TolB-like protein